jgi:predicted ester cyclase
MVNIEGESKKEEERKNKETVRGWYEHWTEFTDREIASKFVSDDVLNHGILITKPGIEAFVEGNLKALENISSFKTTIEDLVSKDDIVVARTRDDLTQRGEFMGMNVEGKNVSVGEISMFRLSNGKIVEWWTQIDSLGMLRQIGFFQSRGQSPSHKVTKLLKIS